MKTKLTPKFIARVMKLGEEYKVKYSVRFTNIEIKNIITNETRFISIHEFIYTHCRHYLVSYANGLRINTETRISNIDSRISVLHFDIYVTVPNLEDGKNIEHTETFSGVSELPLFISAIDWLINYRNDNPKLSKFWINKF